MLFFGVSLQTGYGEGTLSSITYFPGARFIIAGLLSRPGNYYKVGEVVHRFQIPLDDQIVLTSGRPRRPSQFFCLPVPTG